MSITVTQPQNLPPMGTTGGIAGTSTNATAVVSGTEMDASQWRSVAYTCSVAGNAIKWSVFAGNLSNYADEVAVLAATTIAANAANSYATTQAPYLYYRAKIIDDALNTHGTVTIYGAVKL